jgi:hypothetical protein
VIRFSKVIDRLVIELERNSKDATLDGLSKAFQFIQIPLYPIEYFEEGANFIWTICGKYATSSESIRIRHTFAQVIVDLCQNVAEVLACYHNVNNI